MRACRYKIQNLLKIYHITIIYFADIYWETGRNAVTAD